MKTANRETTSKFIASTADQHSIFLFEFSKHFRYLDFVAMSMCGGLDQGGPTDEEFQRNIIQYSEVRSWGNL